MKKSILFFTLSFSFILCTIESKLITTFLFLLSILFLYFVKLYQKPKEVDTIQGVVIKHSKAHSFYTKTPSFLHIFLIIALFTRLWIFQYKIESDYTKIWCRHLGQEIDILTSWYILENSSSAKPIFFSQYWNFSLNAFLTPDQKQLLLSRSILNLHWKVECLWPWRIIPFTKESLQLSKWNRGVVTKVTSLSATAESVPNPWFMAIIADKLSTSLLPVDSWINTPTAWIQRWILLWDTSLMNHDTYQLFLDSWLVHLVSASWWNILILIQITTALFFFLPIRYRKYLFAWSVAFYFMLVWENISFARAVISFGIITFCIPKWCFHDRKRIFIAVIYILLYINPLYVISSRWLILSASWVRWLLHTPQHRSKIASILLPSLFANIALLGPLFLLIQHINIITLPLGIVASFITTCIVVSSPLTLFTHFSFIPQFFIDILYRLAYRWSTYWVFLSTPSHSTGIALAVRIISWLWLSLSYTHFHTKYLLSLRD